MHRGGTEEEEFRIRVFEEDLDSVVIDDVHAFYRSHIRCKGTSLGIPVFVDAVLHVLCGKGFSVMKLYPFAQVERIGFAIRANLPALGKIGYYILHCHLFLQRISPYQTVEYGCSVDENPTRCGGMGIETRCIGNHG